MLSKSSSVLLRGFATSLVAVLLLSCSSKTKFTNSETSLAGVSDFKAESTDDASVMLTWKRPLGMTEGKYEIQIYRSGNPEERDVKIIEDFGVDSYERKMLSYGSEYTFGITVFSKDGSKASQEVTATAMVKVPSVVLANTETQDLNLQLPPRDVGFTINAVSLYDYGYLPTRAKVTVDGYTPVDVIFSETHSATVSIDLTTATEAEIQRLARGVDVIIEVFGRDRDAKTLLVNESDPEKSLRKVTERVLFSESKSNMGEVKITTEAKEAATPNRLTFPVRVAEGAETYLIAVLPDGTRQFLTPNEDTIELYKGRNGGALVQDYTTVNFNDPSIMAKALRPKKVGSSDRNMYSFYSGNGTLYLSYRDVYGSLKPVMTSDQGAQPLIFEFAEDLDFSTKKMPGHKIWRSLADAEANSGNTLYLAKNQADYILTTQQADAIGLALMSKIDIRMQKLDEILHDRLVLGRPVETTGFSTLINNCESDASLRQTVGEDRSLSVTTSVTTESGFETISSQTTEWSVGVSVSASLSIGGFQASASIGYNHSQSNTTENGHNAMRAEKGSESKDVAISIKRSIEAPKYATLRISDKTVVYDNVEMPYAIKYRITGNKATGRLTGEELITQIKYGNFDGSLEAVGSDYIDVVFNYKMTVSHLIFLTTEVETVKKCDGYEENEQIEGPDALGNSGGTSSGDSAILGGGTNGGFGGGGIAATSIKEVEAAEPEDPQANQGQSTQGNGAKVNGSGGGGKTAGKVKRNFFRRNKPAAKTTTPATPSRPTPRPSTPRPSTPRPSRTP